MNFVLYTLARALVPALLLVSLIFTNATAAPGEPGTIDATWGGGTGRVFTPIGIDGAGVPSVIDAALQLDGRLLVAAYCRGIEANANLVNPCLVRYLPDGALDTSFANGGIFHQSLRANFSDVLLRTFVLPDQKILLIADCGSTCVARLNVDGSFDTSFGGDGTGIRILSFNSPPFGVGHADMHPDGRITIAGFCTDGRMCAARILLDGSLDGTFGNLGLAVFDITAGADSAAAVVAEPDGSATMAGICDGRACVARLTPDGTLDTNFNGTGFRLLLCPAPTDYANRIRRQPDGKYVLGGTVPGTPDNSICVMRLNANGSIDAGFATGGTYAAIFGTTTTLGDIHLQPDGRIIVAGSCTGPTSVCARRLNGDGTVDPSFANANGGTLAFGGGMVFSGIPARLVSRPDGNFYIVNPCRTGSFSSPNQICTFRFEGGPQAYSACSLDFDGDGQALSRTDLLLLLRMSLGFKGSAITGGVTFPAHATRTDAAFIERYAVDYCGFRN